MREKAKELQRARMEANKKGGYVKGGGPLGGQSGGFGSSSTYSTPAVINDTPSDSKPLYSPIS